MNSARYKQISSQWTPFLGTTINMPALKHDKVTQTCVLHEPYLSFFQNTQKIPRTFYAKSV